MIVVNLFGGPGIGKSTLAARVYSELSVKGYSTELVTEVAKEFVWDDTTALLNDQLLVTANQNHRIDRLRGKVDIVVTDSPVLQGMVYRKFHNDEKYSSTFDKLIWEIHHSYDNVNFILPRRTQFQYNGRIHDENSSTVIDTMIHDTLLEDEINTYILYQDESILESIMDIIENKIATF